MGTWRGIVLFVVHDALWTLTFPFSLKPGQMGEKGLQGPSGLQGLQGLKGEAVGLCFMVI